MASEPRPVKNSPSPAARVSEERLRQLFASAQDAVIVMDTTGLVVDWNPCAERLFGWTADEAIGQRLSDMVVPPEFRERHEAGLKRYVDTRQGRIVGRSVELTALARGGHHIPIELSLWPLESEGELLFGAFIRDIYSRQAAEKALRQQEEKYRQVVDYGSEGILVVSDGKIVFANPATERLIGATFEQMQQVPFTDWIYPDDRALVVDRHVRRLRGEEVESQYSFRVVRRDGALVWLELSVVSIEWEGQTATLSFITDITERKRLEQSLQQSLAERDTILENSIVGILFMDTERRIRWANSALTSMFGLPLGAAVGETSERFYPSPEAYRQSGEAVRQAILSGTGFEIEMQMRRVDGELFWAYVSGRAVDSRDLMQGTVWALIDITARKELERALEHKTTEQEAILQSTLVGISLLSQQRFQWVNRTLAEMFGFRPEQLIGQHASVIFSDPQTWAAFVKRVMHDLDSQGSCEGEQLLHRRDGTPIWVQLQGKRIQSQDGSLASLWTFLDITERKRADEDMQRNLAREKELGQLKSRFVSMTSHEFRTPLAGILSSVELLRHYGARLPEEEKIELFQQIESSVERMTTMLDNILLIGRADAQGLKFKPAPMDLVSLCRELAEEATRSRPGGDGRPTLAHQIEGIEGDLVMDATLLRHILSNLLSNAFKYSPAGGDVTFSVRRTGDRIRFDVADQGIGIPQEDQARLFESFHRASNVGNISGTGLGLAIVKQSVELHGGSIAIDSAPGRGTRFTVDLPIDPRTEAP